MKKIIKLMQSPLEDIKKLNLPTKDYAIFGSAIMFFHGLKELDGDIDIIARGEAWEKACKLGTPQVPNSKKGLVVQLFNGAVEIFSDWFPGDWNIDNLIDSAKEIEGIKVVGFNEVIKWKKLMGREKDIKHIKVMEAYLKKTNENP